MRRHAKLFTAERVYAESALVVLYSVWEHREFRTLGVVVGPRTILTCGHTVTQTKPSDGKLLHVFLDDYPRRLGRCEVLGRYPSARPNNEHGLGVLNAVIYEGIAALQFKADAEHLERTARFWDDRIITIAADRDTRPAYMVCESGMIPWPCETGAGFSGAPVLNEDLELVGVHYGREWSIGDGKTASASAPPVVIPLPEGLPWERQAPTIPVKYIP